MGQPTEVSAKASVKFAKIDNSVFDPEPNPELDSKTETPREKIQRQRRERHEQSEKTWAYVQENDARYAAHRANISKHKNIDLGDFNLEEVLAHPELDAVKPVKIDPVSMEADDIDSFMKEGKEFSSNPTWAGLASMAVIAIPGKVLDDVGGKLVKEAFERNPLKTLNGRKIYNSDLAGKAVQTKGGEVWFDFDGFPDFTPYSKKIVRVDGLTGKMAKDVPAAMKKAKLTEYDSINDVWHHHQDGVSMMLVPRNVHSHLQGGVSHSGGRAVMAHNANNPDNILRYPSPDELF
ncbi:HNH endonuclease [Photobacterium kishitanii]|uniref:HNH endonuclease n=1 Tax=Photobacterium kishitanii TaxID=318456 RepID=UPI001F19550A|nr:HNH endonuclease [Photobacterium kishitanii]